MSVAGPGPRGRGPRAWLDAIVLLAGVAYTLTASRAVLGGDNGEFAALYAEGGIAHPPGYPAMVLWLRLLRWLPCATPAHGAALATAVLGAAGVWALQRACLAWGASAASTALVSVVYAASPIAWEMSTHAEAFAMNAFFAGILLALAAPEPALHGARQTLALGLVAGLALADHQSIALLAPIGLLAAVRGAREAKHPWRAAIAGALALLTAFTLPYVYVYVVARTCDPRTTPMWLEAPTVAGLLFHVRRGAYGTFALAGTPAARDTLANLALFARSAVVDLLGLPIVALAAAFTPRARAVPGRELGSRIALLATFALAGPLFVGSFDLSLENAGPTVAARFYLLPELVLTLLGALALDALAPRFVARRPVMAVLTALAALAATIRDLPRVLDAERPTVELYVDNTLRGAPRDAIIVGTGDHRWGGFLYARYALHERTDVFFVVPGLLTQAWYRRLVEAMVGVSVEAPGRRPVGPKTLQSRLLATGRPLLYTDWPDASVARTPHESVGTLMRVLREGEARSTPGDLEAENLAIFARYDREASVPADPRGWGYLLQGDYARPWGELGQAYEAQGDVAKAAACYARAARFAPWLVRATRGTDGAPP